MRRLLGIALLLVMLCALPAVLMAQPAADQAGAFDYRLRARELAPGVYVVAGAHADFSPANGCNIINTGFIATGDGVVVINTGPSRRYGEQLRALIARTTSEPLRLVLHLNQHPDYFLGSAAFADLPRLATPRTRAGMQAEGAAYEANLYRLCGDWMTGTERLLPSADALPGPLAVAPARLALIELQGHTASDLVLVDKASGVVFAGGLVFARRVPTTPHADLPAWQASLRVLEDLQPRWLVPSHGEIHAGLEGLAMTRRYLQWLDTTLRDAAQRGLDMNEVLALPVPAEYRAWAAFDTEFLRNVAHLYPRFEQAVLPRPR